MDAVRKKKIIGKMYTKGLCTKDEYESGNVSMDRIEMFIKDIPLLEGDKTITGQIQYRSEIIDIARAEQNETVVSHNEKILKKLYELREKASTGENDKVVLKFHKTGARTQYDEVKRHLEENGSITSWDAFTEYGITRLSHIIYKLRHREGLGIGAHTVTRNNRYGNPVNFSVYTYEKVDTEAKS